MKKTPIFIVIFLVLISNITSAQVKLTLDDCINIALKNNLEIKQSVLDVERQRLVKSKAVWNNMPRVDLVASQDYEFGFIIDPVSNNRTKNDFLSNDFSLRASLDVLDLAKIKAVSKASTDYEKSIVDYEIGKNEVLLTIAQYYLDVMFRTEYVGILENQLEESENQLDRLNEALSFGYIAKSELYDAQAGFSIDKKAVLVAENNRKRAVLNLINLINYDRSLDEVEFFDILFQVDTTSLVNKEQYLSEAYTNNPRMLSAQYDVESAEKSVGINRANGLPSIQINYQLGSFFSKEIGELNAPSFEDQINENKSQFLGGTLRVPLFNAAQNKHNIKLAKIDLEKTKINEDIVKSELRFAVEQTIQDLENAVSAYQSSIEVLNAARESFRTSKLKYEQGKINAFDFATAKKNLLQTEFDLLDSKFKLYYNRTRLNFLTKSDFKL